MIDRRLESGEQLTTEGGMVIVVDDHLGGGGQGDVYRVHTPEGHKALKYYHSSTSTPEQLDNLRSLVSIGFNDHRFLWPLDTILNRNDGRFGYLMGLRPQGWATVPDLLTRRVKGATLRSLYRMGIHLASAYRELHAKGMAYRDINWGNVFFHPESGDVLICDNDNALYGRARAGVRGTNNFMAPEVLRGEADPSAQTDLHSLAVLLFMVFVNGHPLQGSLEASVMCLDEEAEMNLYGTSPVFIFDKDDVSNRPMPGIHDAVIGLWPMLPQELQELFYRSFTEGLHDAPRRVSEGEWVKALSLAHDRIYKCSSCGRANVFDKRQHDRTGVVGNCWGCQRPLQRPPLLMSSAGGQLVLDPGTRLFRHHVDRKSEFDFTSPIAELVESTKSPGKFGLKNLGSSTWTRTEADGSIVGVEPGQASRLRRDLQLEIDGVKFTVG